MSTDNSNLLSNKTSVTTDMLYTMKASAGTTSSYRATIPSQNKSVFNCGDVMIFQIPCGRKNSYLDGQNSYLKICIQNNDVTAANVLNLDHSGYGLINQLTVFQSGNLIEQISNYNVLLNGLIDFQMDGSSSMGYSTILGTASNTSDSLISNGTAIANNAVLGTLNTPLNSLRRGNSIPASGRLTLCLPIVSSLFTLSDKMIPIGRLNSDIELQFLLENLTQSVVCPAVPTAWTIINAELVLNIVTLSDTAEEIVRSVSPIEQPIFIHSSSYRSYPQTLATASTGNQTFLISSRFNSLKSIHLFPRRSTEINDQSSYSLSSRINPNIQQYYWTCGGNVIPNKPITLNNTNSNGGYAECYSEVLKAYHSFGNINSYGSIVGANAYNVIDSAAVVGEGIKTKETTSNSYGNAFAIGLELECYSSGRNDTILNGINTIGQNVFFNSLHSGTALSAAFTMNFFAYFDCILVIQDGIMKCLF